VSARLALSAAAALAGMATLGLRGSRARGDLPQADLQVIQGAAEVLNPSLQKILVRGGFAESGDPRLASVDAYSLDEWLHATNKEGWAFEFNDVWEERDILKDALKSKSIKLLGVGGYRYAIELPDSGLVAKLPLHSEGADGNEMEVHAWANSRNYPHLRRRLLPVVHAGRVRTRRSQSRTVPFLVMPKVEPLRAPHRTASAWSLKGLIAALTQTGMSKEDAHSEVSSFLQTVQRHYRFPGEEWGDADPRTDPEVVICTSDIAWSNLAMYEGRLVLLDYQCI
jgi:hypothetical protein